MLHDKLSGFVAFWSECKCGPGYATPLDAVRNGPVEKLLYVVCVQPNLDEEHGDYLATVDVDPASPTYCQVSEKLPISMSRINL